MGDAGNRVINEEADRMGECGWLYDEVDEELGRATKFLGEASSSFWW